VYLKVLYRQNFKIEEITVSRISAIKTEWDILCRVHTIC